MTSESLAPPAPAMDDPRYLVEDPRAIRHLLEDLARRAIPLSVQAEGSDMVSPSLVLGITPGSSVELDGSNIDAFNSRIARSQRLYCFAEMDKVQLRFILDNPIAQTKGTSTSFCTEWPTRFYHHQRREVFRLKTPLQDSPTFSFEIGEPPERHELRITDISVGGIGVQHDLPSPALDLGTVLEHCQIQLCDEKLTAITLKVVNERPVPLIDGLTARRNGLAFVALPLSAQNSISRYIFSVERQRNARRNGKV